MVEGEVWREADLAGSRAAGWDAEVQGSTR